MKRLDSNSRSGASRLLHAVMLMISANLGLASSQAVMAQTILGEEPALGAPESRITQGEIRSLPLLDVRLAGLKIFATQFRKADGYGDGPVNHLDPLSPGGRPTLQNNGTFLQINGLDAQSCQDCHGVLSADATPFVPGVGGSGTGNNAASFMPASIDPTSEFGNYTGRFINPPATFGTGPVQLVGNEMTVKLQRLKRRAINNPGVPVTLRAKGIYFGTIVADEHGNLNTDAVEGVDADLIVRPFGRKGGVPTVRQFDLGALMFHLGIQPVEIVGEGIDADGDGVLNEVMIGEVSALEIFLTTQETPQQLAMGWTERRGRRLFRQIGCTGCHKPQMTTHSSILTYSFPEIPEDPSQNVFYSVDLTNEPPALEQRGQGVVVRMFSDLKRHDMGPGLAEDFHGATAQQNAEFITAKLWGVADTAPYLHDGRALTLNEAITLHSGEAEAARNAFSALSVEQRNRLLSFLLTLRNPTSPNHDVLN